VASPTGSSISSHAHHPPTASAHCAGLGPTRVTCFHPRPACRQAGEAAAREHDAAADIHTFAWHPWPPASS
jgi:hypothetical protein